MIKVAKDKGGDWFFIGNKTYVCLNNNKNVIAKIYSCYLPNPIKIWDLKCSIFEVLRNSKEGQSLKPSETIFKLWEHNNANVNN